MCQVLNQCIIWREKEEIYYCWRTDIGNITLYYHASLLGVNEVSTTLGKLSKEGSTSMPPEKSAIYPKVASLAFHDIFPAKSQLQGMKASWHICLKNNINHKDAYVIGKQLILC